MRNYTFLEFTAGLLDKTPGRTATLDIMGTRLVLTDRQENITAVMLSQVHITSSSQLCRLISLLFPSASQKEIGWISKLRINSSRILEKEKSLTKFSKTFLETQCLLVRLNLPTSETSE